MNDIQRYRQAAGENNDTMVKDPIGSWILHRDIHLAVISETAKSIRGTVDEMEKDHLKAIDELKAEISFLRHVRSEDQKLINAIEQDKLNVKAENERLRVIIKKGDALVAEALENYKAEKAANGWISVDDRLPEYEQRVIVRRRRENPEISTQIIHWTNGDEQTYSHWIPEPQPPTSEDL